MPSMDHEALVELFRNRPSLGAELLVGRFPIPVAEPRLGEADASQLLPTERRADLVIWIDTMGMVYEVQLAEDASKRLSWPVYLASLRGRNGGEVVLVVVTLNEAVERWARTPIQRVLGLYCNPRFLDHPASQW